MMRTLGYIAAWGLLVGACLLVWIWVFEALRYAWG